MAQSDLPPSPDLNRKMGELTSEIDKFIEKMNRNHALNNLISIFLIALGLVLGVSVSAAGFLGYGVTAGLIGLGITLFIALQNAFSFTEKAEFYRIIHSEAQKLAEELRFKVKNEKGFDGVLATYQVLRTQVAKNLPRGKGMEAVKEIYGGQSGGVAKN